MTDLVSACLTDVICNRIVRNGSGLFLWFRDRVVAWPILHFGWSKWSDICSWNQLVFRTNGHYYGFILKTNVMKIKLWIWACNFSCHGTWKRKNYQKKDQAVRKTKMTTFALKTSVKGDPKNAKPAISGTKLSDGTANVNEPNLQFWAPTTQRPDVGVAAESALPGTPLAASYR